MADRVGLVVACPVCLPSARESLVWSLARFVATAPGFPQRLCLALCEPAADQPLPCVGIGNLEFSSSGAMAAAAGAIALFAT